MTEKRLIPASETQIEFKVANSRFITTAAPAFTVDQAKEFISQVKQRYSDASHNVPVFIIGHGASTTEHSSDAGEPGGTAGRPALAVLRGSGLGDIAVVITRYFGGTKLGTGGLVKAYSDSVREVLAALPKAQKVATVTTSFTLPYPLFEQTKRLADKHKGIVSREEFGSEVTLSLQFAAANFQDFAAQLNQLSNGKISAEIVEENLNTIMPL
ncbi:MAG: YigZ family protein [Chloroflexota bacterium]